MATLKSVNAVATTSTTTLYTVPSNTTTIIKGMIINNNSGNSISPSISILKASGVTTSLWNSYPSVLPYENIQIDANIFLNTGDKINISCTQNSAAEILASLVEI